MFGLNLFGKSSAFALLLAMAAMWNLHSCGKEAKKFNKPKVVKEDEAGPWADSIIKSLGPVEKAGQLMMVTLNASEELESVTGLLSEKNAGGVILGPKILANAKETSVALSAASPFPIWIAAEIDESWCLENRFPNLQSLAACEHDSVLEEWGFYAAGWFHRNGINFVFLSSSLQSPEGKIFEGSMGSQSFRVGWQSAAIHRGFEKGGVTVCERPFPKSSDLSFSKREIFSSFRRTNQQLLNQDLKALCSILSDTIAAIQLENILISGTDSKNPLPLSQKVIEPLLRNNMEFGGLIFSGNLSDSLLNAVFPDGIESKCLRAGTEILVNPLNPAAAAESIAREIEEKKLNLALLDKALKKMLLARAKTFRNFTLLAEPEIEIFNYNVELLRRKVYSAGLIVLRNRNFEIPAGSIETEKAATISCGIQSRSAFQNSMSLFMSMDHFLLSAESTKDQLDAKLGQFSKYHTVFISLHSPGKSAEVYAPEFLSFLTELGKRTRVLVVHFGNPTSLEGLEKLSSLIHSADGSPLSQELAAQLCMGAAPASGRMAWDATASFCSGDGLNSKRVWRLRQNVLPEEAGIDSRFMVRIDSIINAAIRYETFPGCQLLIAKDSKIIYNKAFGFHDYLKTQRVERTDLYDIASVTKMAATTLAIMAAYDADSLKLEGKLKDYIPGFDTTRLKDLLIEDILIHKAGLPPALPVYFYYTVLDSVDSLKKIYYSKERDSIHNLQISKDLFFCKGGRDSVLQRVSHVKPYGRGNYEYSDLGFYLLKTCVEKIYETRIDSFVYAHFYKPMGLHHITYNPLDKFSLDEVCPTELDKWFRGELVHGFVHDQAAALLGGISGHAGLFSNAQDLGAIMQLLLNKGVYGGKRYFEEETVDLFTSRHPECYRGLGFDHQTADQNYGMVCSSASPDCFGHTGFTGTCTWADPQNGIVYIFLSNRVNPDAKNQKINISGVRQAVQQVIYDAMNAMNPKKDPNLSGVDSYLSEGDSLKSENQDTILP